MSGVAGADGN